MFRGFCRNHDTATECKGALIVIEVILVDHENATIDFEIRTSGGVVEILCDYRLENRPLLLLDAHIQGLFPGALGRRGLNEIAQKIMEQADADTVEIHGAIRTTGRGKDDAPGSSEPGVDLVLKRFAPISRPVDVARALKRFGLGLTDAHKVLNRIVADEAIQLTLKGADRATMIVTLAELGVAAE